MDWETKDKERKQKIEDERVRLIALTDYQAESLPVPERYQRIRYLREIYAAKWLADLKRGLPPAQDEPLKRRYKRPVYTGGKIKNAYWKD